MGNALFIVWRESAEAMIRLMPGRLAPDAARLRVVVGMDSKIVSKGAESNTPCLTA